MTDVFEEYSDSNSTMYGTLGDMMLGFNEMVQARDTHSHVLTVCSQVFMHLIDNDIISKLTHGSIVDAGVRTCSKSHVRQ